jgi:AP-4 complex subunit beta-1
MTSKGRATFTVGGGGGGSANASGERRGEVAELRTQLREPAVQRDQQRSREVLKKVLAFLTLGVDTSALFPEMILACVTKDLVQKKMVYLYLCSMSESNHELAILVINTLQKDCRDESPLVRGLALRSLASLRVPQLADYLVPTLKVALTDTAPYVRKTAILATLKLFRVAPEQFRSLGLTDKMYGMLRDNDGLVSTNALAVLNEVLAADGGVQVNKSILYYLLNRLRDFSEWQQPMVLDLVLKYTPASEDEMFDIMNLLEERLMANNAAVILSCTRVFLHLTQSLPTVHAQVFTRLRDPLMTLMSTSLNPETAYVVLCHLRLLAQRDPKILQPQFRQFFLRHSDPTYIRCTKIDLLVIVACDANAKDILAELTEYVGDSSSAISAKAISSMGRVALQVESSAPIALNQFLELLGMDVEHIRGQTLVAMRDFLRKYNDIGVVRPFLDSIVKSYSKLAFSDDDSKVALAWVLGEFGEHIEDAPYILETMCANFAGESAVLRLELLGALMRLFFKRPPEVRPALGRVLQEAVSDFSHADVHDRALLYYRLLRDAPQQASAIVNPVKARIAAFAEHDDSDVRDRLFEEFNTFSVVFGWPMAMYHSEAVPDADEEEEEPEDDEGEDEDEDMLSGVLPLVDEAEIEAADFQSMWGKAPLLANPKLKLRSAPDAEQLEEALQAKRIYILATGNPNPTTTKAYCFAQEADTQSYYLMEVLLSKSGDVAITIKGDDPEMRNRALQDFLHKAFSKWM